MGQRRAAEGELAREQGPLPGHLQEAARILIAKLAEFTTSADKEPPNALKRILTRVIELSPSPNQIVISSRDSSQPRNSSRTPTSSSICRHQCKHHKELLDPWLWRKLPRPVLFQVLARLPLPKIVSLQALSREWRGYFNEDSDSNFLKVVGEAHASLAVLTRDALSRFVVRVLDVRSNRWRVYGIKAGDATAVDVTAASAAGGLVCFISSYRKTKTLRSFLVDVVNPLTQRACVLPPLQDFLVVQMLQVMVNSETNTYKVLAIGEGASGTLLAKMYDPAISSDKWITPPRQRLSICGYSFHWGNFRFNQKRNSPCVYDLGRHHMRPLKTGLRSSPLNESDVLSFAVLGDRVFVLKKDRGGGRGGGADTWLDKHTRPLMHSIVECQIVSGSGGAKDKEEWVKVRRHACGPFEVLPKAKFEVVLFACPGFLMALATLPDEAPYRCALGWLYDLGSCRWSRLPPLPSGDILPFGADDLMCRLHWDASV